MLKWLTTAPHGFGVLQKHLVHRGHRAVPCGQRQPIEEASCIEARCGKHRRATKQRCEHVNRKAVDVKERHHVEADIVWLDLDGASYAQSADSEILVS